MEVNCLHISSFSIEKKREAPYRPALSNDLVFAWKRNNVQELNPRNSKIGSMHFKNMKQPKAVGFQKTVAHNTARFVNPEIKPPDSIFYIKK